MSERAKEAHAQPATREVVWKLWGWPLVLGLLTVVGLISALFSDGGAGDWLAWLTLGVPAAGCLWWSWMRRR